MWGLRIGMRELGEGHGVTLLLILVHSTWGWEWLFRGSSSLRGSRIWDWEPVFLLLPLPASSLIWPPSGWVGSVWRPQLHILGG